MNSTKTLGDLTVGKHGKIIKMNCSNEIKKRLLEMGLVKGTNIILERIAPLGDPIQIKVKGYSLSIRLSEAKNIDIEIT